MDIKLNLLPTEKREEIKRKRYFNFLVFQGSLLLFLMVILILILTGADLFLRINLEGFNKGSISSEDISFYKELEKFEKDFEAIDSKVSLINELEENYLYWFNLLKELSSLDNEGVYLKSLATLDFKVDIAGTARQREDFLGFIESLENSNCFTDVDFPLSVIEAKEDVVFEISFNIKKECLYKTEFGDLVY